MSVPTAEARIDVTHSPCNSGKGAADKSEMSTTSPNTQEEATRPGCYHSDRRMRGWAYVGPEVPDEPIHDHTSDITLAAVINRRRTPKSVERFSSASIEPPSKSINAKHISKLGRTNASSSALLSHSPRARSKPTKRKRGRGISQKKAVFPKVPALPQASCQADRNRNNDQEAHRTRKIDSVVIHNHTPSSMRKEIPGDAHGDTLSSIPSSLEGIDVSRLMVELLDRLKDEKSLTREYRVLKRQYNLWLGVQSHELATLQTELQYLKTKNEELSKQLEQIKPTNRRISQGNHDDLDELETQDRMIRHLKTRLDKKSQIEKMFNNHYGNDWARGPSDTEGNLIKIQISIIRLANTLEKLMLSPKELGISLKAHNKSYTAVELFERSFGDIQLLFTEPWLALRSFLFRFIRDFIFYSDLWTSFHCEGFVAREYQRNMELSAPEGFLERFHATAFYDVLHDTEFKEYTLKPHQEDVREELMQLLIPLMSRENLKENLKDLEGQADSIIEHAFSLRASCIPEPSERFEIMHHRPGDIFDPKIMRAENSDGKKINPPVIERDYRVRVCVHGSMKTHTVEETAKGVDFLKVMGQPFVNFSGRENFNGRLISEKACVILDTE